MALSLRDSRAFELDRIRIATPCSARWDEMTGSDRVRFCAQCSLEVIDAAYLSPDELRALVLERTGGRLCLRLHRRADGTLILRDCPVGVRGFRLRVIALVAAVVGLSWSLGRALRGLDGPRLRPAQIEPGPPLRWPVPARPPTPVPPQPVHTEMGGLAVPDPGEEPR